MLATETYPLPSLSRIIPSFHPAQKRNNPKSNFPNVKLYFVLWRHLFCTSHYLKAPKKNHAINKKEEGRMVRKAVSDCKWRYRHSPRGYLTPATLTWKFLR